MCLKVVIEDVKSAQEKLKKSAFLACTSIVGLIPIDLLRPFLVTFYMSWYLLIY